MCTMAIYHQVVCTRLNSTLEKIQLSSHSPLPHTKCKPGPSTDLLNERACNDLSVWAREVYYPPTIHQVVFISSPHTMAGSPQWAWSNEFTPRLIQLCSGRWRQTRSWLQHVRWQFWMGNQIYIAKLKTERGSHGSAETLGGHPWCCFADRAISSLPSTLTRSMSK